MRKQWIILTVVLLAFTICMPAYSYRLHPTWIWCIDETFNTKDYRGNGISGLECSTWNGKDIVVDRHHEGGPDDDIYVWINGEERFLSRGFSPWWSPDGKWIFFCKYTGDTTIEIFKVRPDGTQCTQLTHDNKFSMQPSCSYDGKYVVYTYDDFLSFSEIRIIDYSGRLVSAPLQADFKEEFAITPRFSPDGKRILYASTRGNAPSLILPGLYNTDIWIMNVDGSNRQRLTYGMCAASPTMRQDGLIAFHTLQAYKSLSKFYQNDIVNGHIYLMMVGEQPEPLFASAITRRDPRFTYDGKLLYFAAAHQ